MAYDELRAVLMPNGALQLEWVNVSGKMSNRQNLLQNEIYEQYLSEPDSWLFLLGFTSSKTSLSSSLVFWRKFAALFINTLRLSSDLEELRGDIKLPLGDDELSVLLDTAPLMTGSEYLQPEVLAAVWDNLHQSFSTNIDEFEGTVEAFIKEYSPDVHLAGRIYFHLVENKDHDVPFAFLATYSTTVGEEGESKHLPLKFALQEYSDDQARLLKLLVTVDTAAKKSSLIRQMRDSGDLFHPLAWSGQQAFIFLREIPLYEESGIVCRMPNWWKKKSANISVAITVGERVPSMVGMNALLDFRPRLMVGDTEISVDEARRLQEESEGLVFLKNKWVAVDQEKLRQALEAYDKTRQLDGDEGMTLLEAMRFSMSPQKELAQEHAEAISSVSHGQWLKRVFSSLQNSGEVGTVTTGKTFKAKLRGYQQDGLNWLYTLHRLKLGGCLADDMGLGKTIQVLAFLNALKTGGVKKAPAAFPSLLILPASLLSNWISEIERFYPSLPWFAAHPDLHKPGQVPVLDGERLKTLDLVITTYQMVQRYTWLQENHWHYVILDEAQAIKNPGTKQTKAVKGLKAQNRIIMTGTPVENSLSDLWSLFDFVNPGLLGNLKEFGEFTKRLSSAPAGYARLRNVISPFILRRLKSDKTIISDLPEKVEMKSWAPMSKKQVVLYREVLERINRALEESEGIQRKGIILSALMKFKQLCNHPAQYLGDELFEEKESGKFQRLREVCETIYEKRERVLVFTQFKEMTEPLSRFLATIFQREGLVLHGSVPVGQRKKLIEQFQQPHYVPFLVLSLKAGGVGLNLTAANHVIHFDRWWNPAVENQATDRAFRLGQKKNVMVHKFLTKGTIEEKIDRMLTAKAKRSAEVVAATGENWITEMSNDELRDLFTLTV